jgi:hypothetical protein
VTKHNPKPALVNLSVEEENLAAIPFAVLERRVGKRIGKIEIKGTKILPNGGEMEVVWQIQGNNELGLPTEQDLDIFVVLGVLTFRNNFAKTVTFSGREIARMLNINSVHGKFYQRLEARHGSLYTTTFPGAYRYRPAGRSEVEQRLPGGQFPIGSGDRPLYRQHNLDRQIDSVHQQWLFPCTGCRTLHGA